MDSSAFWRWFGASQALEAAPGNAAIYESRAHAYIKAGEFLEAANDAAKAIELDPGMSKAYMRRGCDRRTCCPAQLLERSCHAYPTCMYCRWRAEAHAAAACTAAGLHCSTLMSMRQQRLLLRMSSASHPTMCNARHGSGSVRLSSTVSNSTVLVLMLLMHACICAYIPT